MKKKQSTHDHEIFEQEKIWDRHWENKHREKQKIEDLLRWDDEGPIPLKNEE